MRHASTVDSYNEVERWMRFREPRLSPSPAQRRSFVNLCSQNPNIENSEATSDREESQDWMIGLGSPTPMSVLLVRPWISHILI